MEQYAVLARQNLSTLSFAIGLPIGAVNEPIPGITSVMIKHLFRNTKKRTEAELADYYDKFGISTIGDASRTSSYLGMTLPPKNIETAENLFMEMVLEPEFDENITQNIINQQKGELMQLKQMAQQTLFNFTIWNAAYGDSLIAKSKYGTEEDLVKITTEDLYKYHSEIFKYKFNFASVGKGIKKEDFDILSPLLDKFGNTEFQDDLYNKKVEPYNTVVDKMHQKSMNAYLGINVYSLGNDDSKYEDIIFNSLLSAGSSSRMFREIRGKRNLSYGPFSMNNKIGKLGLITAGMDILPERSHEGIKVTLETMKSLLNDKIPEDEMRRAVKLSQRVNVFVSDTSSSYTSWVINKMNSGMGYDMEKEKEKINAASQSEWQEKMSKVIVPKNFTLGVAGEPGSAPDEFGKIVEEVLS